ncbi:flagellar protein FlaJ [Methanohalophilus levihalophilus]|uniref:type II secretion system F family protein n=1 Tax=Methanohalophilus levihalophilus TaxID=1431282 RepID=UPI001AE4366F|nr:type II secretion system F family protein [Methanohalophilus levihalophilus]MBP2029449.1 flagellar protein FlaJ [Methanohalophilus levihalophilus]
MSSNFRMMMERYLQLIRLRYDVRRGYFTAALPLVIALLILFSAVMTGHTFPSQQLDSSFSGGSLSEEDAKKAAYQALVAQMEAEEAGIDPATLEERPAEEGEETARDNLDHILVYALLIGIIPYSIDSFFQKKNQMKKEVAFSEFLFKMSELMRGGIDPVKAVIDLAKTDLGSMNSPIKSAASKMVLGYSFSDAMGGVAEEMNSNLISKYINVVVQAAYTGGNVADLLQRTSEDMRAVIAIEREKESNLKQYVIIFYLAQGIVIMLSYLLSTSLLPMIQGVGAQMLGGVGLSDINFQYGFFHMILLNGLFGGLIIGQISEGELKHGLKHSAILIIGSYIACTILILPTLDAASLYSVDLVSGDGQSGFGGLTLTEPLVFQVVDKDGNPVPDTFVYLSIAPSGMVSGVLETDDGGNVSVSPVLGDSIGAYTITAQIGDSTAVAMASVIDGS